MSVCSDLKRIAGRNLINIPGWRTNRKTVVVESDDWGSIRMSSRENREKMQTLGFDLKGQDFNLYDALESNDDLSMLFDVLSRHKDNNGNNPLFTAVSIVGNPDFEKLWRFRARYFVATNGPFNNSLEPVLKKNGIDYILAERFQQEPLGDGKYAKHICFIGSKSTAGQTYITRNGFFEPSITNSGLSINPIERCLNDITTAFRWGKPAVISTHRLNYIGFINPANRERNLALLESLLSEITKRWPEVEFMNSVQLGDLITRNNG